MGFSWLHVLAVAVGGGSGACLRWAVSLAWTSLERTETWPWPTFVCNLAGSLLIGVLHGWWLHHDPASVAWRLLLVTGLLGGFTTFSAFSFETLGLLQRGQTGLAMAYSALSVVAGLSLALVGWWLGRSLA